MAILATETLALRTAEDVVIARQQVRARAIAQGFSLVDQTKLVTAASELARNTLHYGGGGTMQIQMEQEGTRLGVRLIFEDAGPGIPDVELAMKDGYTSGHGLGLGLGGAKRLSNEFAIESAPGRGTKITIARWR
jgi:serine/threonine-protein kinase RsbT